MINFSLILPTRGRPKRFSAMLNSIVATTHELSQTELIVGLDNDDKHLDEYERIINKMNGNVDELMKESFSIKTLIQDRPKNLCEYYNAMAKKSEGKYIWALNDDCLIRTNGWDSLILDKIKTQGLKVFYVRIGGDGHKAYYTGMGHNFASGFPMLSRTAVEVMGYYYNPKIKGYKADKLTHNVFYQAEAIINAPEIDIHHFKGASIGDDTWANLKKMGQPLRGIVTDMAHDIKKIKGVNKNG